MGRAPNTVARQRGILTRFLPEDVATLKKRPFKVKIKIGPKRLFTEVFNSYPDRRAQGNAENADIIRAPDLIWMPPFNLKTSTIAIFAVCA